MVDHCTQSPCIRGYPSFMVIKTITCQSINCTFIHMVLLTYNLRHFLGSVCISDVVPIIHSGTHLDCKFTKKLGQIKGRLLLLPECTHIFLCLGAFAVAPFVDDVKKTPWLVVALCTPSFTFDLKILRQCNDNVVVGECTTCIPESPEVSQQHTCLLRST